MVSRHIVKTGPHAGDLVPCGAEISCRNGGRHVDNVTANAIANWVNDENTGDENAKKASVSTLNSEQLEAFLALPDATKNTYIAKEVDRQVEASKTLQAGLVKKSKKDLLADFTGKKPSVPAPPREATKQPAKTPPPARPSAPNVAPLPPVPSTVPPIPGKFKRITDGIPPRPGSQ